MTCTHSPHSSHNCCLVIRKITTNPFLGLRSALFAFVVTVAVVIIVVIGVIVVVTIIIIIIVVVVIVVVVHSNKCLRRLEVTE